MLGEYGIATKLEEDEEDKLSEFWKDSPLLPSLGEQDTTITGREGKLSSMSNVCPEVSYEVFGFFASYLSRYADEIDSMHAHKQLKARAANSEDWRWMWQFLHAAHYFDCPLYSSISGQKGLSKLSKIEKEIVQLKPGIFGFSIDLKEIYKRLKRKFV